MIAHLLSLAGIALFPLPGLLLTRGWLRNESASPAELPSEDALIVRVSLGYAIGTAILYATSQMHLGLFLITYAGLLILMIGLRFRQPAGQRWRMPQLSPELRILLPILTVYLAVRLVPAISRELPTGWDPYFSLLFADQISLAHQAIHDWRPYENIELNYPIGPHLLIGLIAWIGRIEPHIPFKMAIPWFISLTGLQIFGLLRRASRNPTLALYATVAYLFTADWGSFGYALWGGLPNLLGMYVFLGAVALVAQVTDGETSSRATPREVLLLAISLLAVSLIHHHCMVSAALVMAWMLARTWLSGSRRPPRMSESARRLALDLILKGAIAAAVIGAPYFIGYALKIPRISQSGLNVLHEGAMSPKDLDDSLGPCFFFAACFGWLIFARKRREYPVSPILLWATSGFMFWFFIGDYAVRIVTIILFYKQVAPFTPTRLLTDAVMLLSFFAGVFWLELSRSLALSRRTTLGLIMLGAAWLLPTYKDTFREPVTDASLQAYAWIRANSRPDAWVWDGSDFHTSYLTRRASGNVPFPTSEFRFAAGIHTAIEEVIAGRITEAAKGKQFLYVLRESAPVPPESRVVWAEPSGAVRIAERFLQ